MVQKTTTIKLSVRDDFSKQLRGFADALEDSERAAVKTGNTFKTKLADGAKVAVAGITAAGVAFGAFAIKAASDAEEAGSKFDEVFGGAAERTGEALDEFGEIANRSGFALREMAADVGALLEPMLGSKDAAADMSIQLTKLATDLGSFNNVAEEDALIALRAGLIGSSEPLLAFGVDVRDAQVKAEAYTTGIAELGDELTQQQKIQARYNIILKQTQTASGDAERTSGSFANTLKGFEASVQNLMVTVGRVLIPIAKDVVKFVGQVVEELDKVFNAAGRFRDGIEEATAVGKDATQTYADYSAVIQQNTDELAANLGGANLYIDAQGNLIRVIGEGIFATERLFQANAQLTESQFAAVQAGALLEESDRRLALARGSLTAKTEDAIPSLLDLKKAEEDLKAEQKAAEQAAKDQAKAEEELAARLEDSRQAAADSAIEFTNLAQSLVDATSADLANVAIGNLGQSLKDGQIDQGQYAEATNKILLGFGLATKESIKMTEALGDVQTLFEDGQVSADEYVDILGALPEAGGNLGKALRDLDIDLSAVKKVTDENELSNLALIETQQDMSENTANTNLVLAKMKDRLFDVREISDDATLSIAALESPTRSAGEAARDAAAAYREWAESIVESNEAASQAGSAIPLPQAPRNVPQRQHGGRARRGQPLIVGERGREPFIPDQSGTVISNADFRRRTEALASGGGQVFNITVTVNGSVASPRRTGREIGRGIKEELGADTRATFGAQGS